MPSRRRLFAKALVDNPVLSEIIETPSTSIPASMTSAIDSAAGEEDPLIIVSTPEDLPSSGSLGLKGFVQSTNRLYNWSGSGWYNIAVTNETPTWDSGGQPNSSYDLDSSGGDPLIINLAATDPDGLPISYSYTVSDSAQYVANIVQDSSQITITSKSRDSLTSTYSDSYGPFSFTSTFKASDGINYAAANSEFTLRFTPPITTIVTDGTTTWDLSTTDIVLSVAQVKNIYWDANMILAPITVKMWGAGGGGHNYPYGGNKGGGGGFSSGTITWDAEIGATFGSATGRAMSLVVGGRGREGSIVPSGGISGVLSPTGGNGGGSNSYGNSGGGGLTGIFFGSYYNSQPHSVMIAGGGGGAANTNETLAGGGLQGQSAGDSRSGQGGTQFAGGAGGVGGSASGTAGSALQGGTGAPVSGSYTGGGGGGGYYGGGGGGHTSGAYVGGGGGGSGYLHPTYITNGTTTTGSYSTPANSADPDRGTAGQGGTNGSDNATDGKIIISLAP